MAKALAKQEAKREKKMTRKKEWDELYYRLDIVTIPLYNYYNPGNQKKGRRTQL